MERATDAWRPEAAGCSGVITEPQPFIFLSHSGREKEFVADLYQALKQARHHPFFDEDPFCSLPRGENYALRIFRACRGCKMAVVVLSHSYVETLWPMWELQEFFLHNPGCLIYPLFYGLQPADLSNAENLGNWRRLWADKEPGWQQRASELQGFMMQQHCEFDVSLKVDKWEEILKKLQYRSGEVWRIYNASNVEQVLQIQSRQTVYINAIVSNICSMLQPHQRYSIGDQIKGTNRMIYQEIVGLFDKQLESQQSAGFWTDNTKLDVGPAPGVQSMTSVVGVYGIGGSGKSTLCKCLANFYSGEFCGRSWWLEFPSNANESMNLVAQINSILSSMSPHGRVELTSLAEAMAAFEDVLKRSKVFLALDNVWDVDGGGVDDAKKLVSSMVSGSESCKVLVTSRSKEILKRVLLQARPTAHNNIMRVDDDFIVHVPSMNEADVVEALQTYCGGNRQPPLNKLFELARCCFIREQCYPLFVRMIGTALRAQGREWLSIEQWETWKVGVDALTHGEIYYEEEYILPVLQKSFDMLTATLQDLFSDLATCPLQLPLRSIEKVIDVDKNCKWLAAVYGGNATADQLMHQILTLEYHGVLELVNYDSGKFIRIHDLHKRIGKKRAKARPDALFKHVFQGNWEPPRVNRRRPYTLLKRMVHRILILSPAPPSSWAQSMGKCKYVRAWCYWSPGILDFSWINGHHLEILCLYQYNSLYVQYCRRGWIKARNLRVMILEDIDVLEDISGCSWEGVPNLVELRLTRLTSLRRVGGMGCLKALESLEVSGCRKLEAHALVDDSRPAARSRVRSWSRPLRTGLVRAGDVLPKLRILNVSCNGDSEQQDVADDDVWEAGALFDAFPVLQTLNLSSCKLRSLRVGGLHSLRTLDLSYCELLTHIYEGSSCSLTALEELDVSDCTHLQGIPDLSGLPRLRVLRAGSCFGLLHEMKLYNHKSRSAGSNLREIDLRGINCKTTLSRVKLLGDVQLESTSILEPAVHSFLTFDGVQPFSQLRKLKLDVPAANTDHFCHLDLSAVPHMEDLYLEDFINVREVCLKHAVNLISLTLNEFPSLEAVTGLGTHNLHLSGITIIGTDRLASIAGLRLLPVLKLLRVGSDNKQMLSELEYKIKQERLGYTQMMDPFISGPRKELGWLCFDKGFNMF